MQICLRRRYNDPGHLDRWEHWDAATGSMQSWSWRKNDAASFVLSAGTRTSLGDADWRLDFIFSPSLNARTPLGPATTSAGSQERQILGWQMDQEWTTANFSSTSSVSIWKPLRFHRKRQTQNWHFRAGSASNLVWKDAYREAPQN